MSFVDVPQVSNVTPGGTFTVAFPVGRTYRSVQLKIAGLLDSEVTNLSLKLNGKSIEDWGSLAEINTINKYYGRGDGSANGYYSLHFSRPELNDVSRDATALGTSNLETMTLEGMIAAAPAAAGVPPAAITVKADVSAPRPLGLITKVKRFPVTFATGGVQQLATLPRGPRIIAAHLFNDAATLLSAVRVEANAVTVIKGTVADLADFESKAERARVPQSGAGGAGTEVALDFCLSGDLADALVTASLNDFRIEPTLTAAGQIIAVIEYLDQFAGI